MASSEDGAAKPWGLLYDELSFVSTVVIQKANGDCSCRLTVAALLLLCYTKGADCRRVQLNKNKPWKWPEEAWRRHPRIIDSLQDKYSTLYNDQQKTIRSYEVGIMGRCMSKTNGAAMQSNIDACLGENP